MRNPRRLTMAQAEKVGRGHPEWQAMSAAERRTYVAKVNAALDREAEAQAYFDSFKPAPKRRKSR